ncbi:BTAD domain-containing putative transcriptional regulator [Nonomuraea sp. NPDC055795]
MRFAVLGPLEVIAGDRPVGVPERKVRALLAGLLAHQGRVVPSVRLIESLWGPEPPGNPLAALRAKVSQLRRALDEAEPGARLLVVTRAPGYLIEADTDAHRFQATLDRLPSTGGPGLASTGGPGLASTGGPGFASTGGPGFASTGGLGERAAVLAEALAWWRGPAFADFADSPLVHRTAVRLEEQRLAAVEDYADVRLALGQDAELVGELSELTAQHPLRERFHALLMRALYRSGRQADALEVYRALRERKREELGLDTAPELAALHQAVLEQRPALRRPPPAPSPAPARLPEPLTELVGRQEALAGLLALAASARLITLTGSGGVGKSRLALEAARRLSDGFPDGAHLVELSASSESEVPGVVAAALGLRDDQLAGALGTRRALLILDNCEHVVEPVAKLADLLLRAAPDLRVLATSREPLGVAGEVVREVAPLDPAAAARLFTARALPGTPLPPQDAEAVEVICRRLDGIPLALELAAARVRSMGIRALADRLDDRFRLLSAGRRAGPAHQRTLKAAIDWSWDLLSEPERVVLRRLAVQVGGCTLEAAERVCAVPMPLPGGPPGDVELAAEAQAAGVGPDHLDPAGVADLLARLVDRSLVVRSGGRYRLLESVSAYGMERLRESGEHDLVLRWYATYYTQFAECAEAYRSGPARHRWVSRLDVESANLRGAREAAELLGDTRLATRLTGSLGWYWTQTGRPPTPLDEPATATL